MSHRGRRSGGWWPRIGVACLATVLATGLLVASNSLPAQAAGTTMVSLPFTGATQDLETTPSLNAPSSVPPSISESGFPCLTAGTDPHHAPIPGCGLSTPDPAGQGALRFNSDTSHGADGLAIGSTLPTAGGLVVTFDMYQYGSGTPGDGMALALSTASPTRLGPAGGDLGYATQGCCDGMVDGYLGVGFDVFGNYTAPGDAGSGCGGSAGAGFSANTVTVRGSGNGQVGYCQLSTSGALAFPLNPGNVSRAAAVRSVQFTLLPSGSYTVAMDPSGGTNYTTVTSGSLPATYFDAATGASVAGVPARVGLVFIGSDAADAEFQEISNLTVATVAGTPPGLTMTESETGSVTPGAAFSYTLTPGIAGAATEADPGSLLVTDPLSAALTVVGTPAGTDWDCSGSTASNVSCAYAGTAASIAAGTTLNPITVSVTASNSVAPGELMNFSALVSDDAEWPVEASATVLVSGTPGPSLATWAQQHPATSPPGRSFAASTFDPAIGATVLFGGVGSSDLGDTWTYDGTTWAQAHPTTSPSARHGALMAFDPDIGSKGLVVLFGGQQSNGAVAGDTWTYDGTTWTQLSPAINPPARVYGSLAFDPSIGTDGEIVLFGGEDQGGGAFGDTWTFDGTHWSQLTPATSPSARVFGSMAFDPVTATMVLFAGADSSDTWSFDGTNWTDVTAATRPPPRLTSSLAFDPAIGSLVMFGGAFNSLDLGDTWSYDGTTWAQQSPAVSPPARSFTTMALDSAGDLVLFGGQLAGGAIAGDTWTFGPVPGVTAGPTTVAATVGSLALGAVPPAALVPTLASVLGSSLKAASAFHDSPFSVSPFSVSPFSVSPFSVSPFSVSPLVDPSLPPITLNEIPLTAPESWAAELAGTPLAALPVQSVTLQQVLALPHPPAVTLGQFDLSGTPLANLSVEAFLLGTTPVASLGNVCPTVATEAVTCSQLSPASHSAIDFELAGDNLNAFYTNPPLPLTALSHLVNSPLTTSLISDWAFDQSPVGGLATSQLPASIVTCPTNPPPAPGTCDTLADAEQHQFVTAGATGGQLLALPASVIGRFTLADLIPAILPSQDLPVNSLSLAAIQALLPLPAAGTPGLVTFDVSAQATCQGLTLVPHLPPGFALIPGSVQVAINGGALQPADVDTATGAITPGPMSPCIGDNSGNATHVDASFQAQPGATLGPVSMSVSVTASGFTQMVSTAPATVTDGQDQAPNTAPPASPTVIPNDTLMLEQIAAPGHTDFFGLPSAEAGATVTVTLSHIPAGQDYDLALFGPPGPQLQPDDDTTNSPFKNSPYGASPVGDETPALGSVTSQTPTVTEADVPQIAGMVMRAVSAQRGNTNESFQFVAGAGDNGPFVVQVSGYNGSSSPQPYVIQAHIVNPPAPLNCQARSYNGGGTVTSLPAMPLPATTQALILVDGKRTGDIYGTAGETAVLAAAQKLSATPVAGQSAAMGTVIPVDGDPAVAAAYQGWDAANCDPSTANAVVAAINALVDRYRVGLKDLRYIVVVGSDEVIPFARIPDLSALGNEEGFDGASFNGLANATSAALSEGYMLSDDAYGDFTPSPWFNASLYVPQVAVGRLVETPADITAAVNAYVTLGGRFNPSSSLTTGYDFMTPAADLVNSALATQVPPGKAALVAPPADPTWSRSDLVTGNSTAQIPPLSSVANGFLSLNAHYDQYQAESAQAFQGTTPDTPITPADLPSNLTNAVLFTMGCHAGLNLADVLVANPTAAQASALGDWAQNVSQRGGLFAGNTGFGEGDTETVAYSERLIAYFAQNLNGQMTIGQALMFAKQHYLDVGAPSVYDAKALEEMVFYGLPMYALGPSGGAAPSVAPQVPPPPLPPSSPPEHAVTPVTFAAAATQLVSHTDGSGHSYFTVGGQFPQVTPYEPVLPRTEIPLPPSTDGETPHGALIEQLTSTDQPGIKPLVDTPVIDENATTVSPAVTEADYPSVLASIDHTLTPAGPLDTLVVVPAQFSQNLERTFSTIAVSVESSNSDDDDPPVIGTVNAGVQGQTVGFTVTTPSLDVTRGVVLFLAKSGSPTGDTWTHVELTNGGNGRWTGGATVPASLANKPIGQYFVQLVDSAGNVATSSNKALNFIAPVLPVSTGIHVMANNAAVAATPYTGPVTISLQDNTGGTGNGAFQLAVDGGPATAYTAPVTLTADGVHMIDATNTADGSHSEAIVTISTQSPTITVTSPADGGQYPLGAVITASFDCASLAGIKAKGCIQTSPAPGAALPNTLGSHTVTFQATDTLLRVTTKTVTYTVVAVSPALSTTTIKASPAKPALGSPVKLSATVAPSGGAGSGPAPTGTVQFYLDGQPRVFATVTLVAGTASVSTSGLGAGSHMISASYGGDTNFLPSSSATTATISVTCKTTITGNHSGSVVLSAGANCVVGATVGAAITVPKGAVLDLEGSTVTGSIVATSPGSVRVCGSTLGGSVTITKATGPVLFGDAADFCAPNRVTGGLTLIGNTGGVQAIGNRVSGAVTASGNRGSGPFPGDTVPIIADNGP